MLRQQQKMPPRAAAGCRRQHKKAACRRECRRRAAKDLIGLVRSCSFGALIRGLQNLESPFKKGFNFVCAKLLFGCAESRFVEPRSSLRGSTDWYFLRRAKSTAKTRRWLRPSGLPGTIQSSIEEAFSRVFQRHEPKPVFRTRRRRKGFESVRGSGVTA